jgi:hypothetical protein
MRLTSLLCALAVTLAGCSAERIVNNDEPRPTLSTTPAKLAPPPPPNNHLVNAFDYAARPSGQAVYYFITPSGRWLCAIVPHVHAGCQSSSFPSAMGVRGEPATVLDALGGQTTPNALLVERDGDPRFVGLDQSEFALETAKVLPFNKILAAAGFRCNVQEASGVSCMSEASGKGFTFSVEGVVPQYTEVPAGAP